jgi:aminopeptidase N
MPLDGRDLELVSVKINGRTLATGEYARDDDSITLSGLGDAATVEVVTRIRPATPA